MNTCPNCRTNIEDRTTVCECGEILFGEVTNVQPWETETVLHAVKEGSTRRLAAVSVVLVVAATIVALAWPQLRVGLNAPENAADAQTLSSNVSQNPAQSDIIPADDLIESETTANPTSPAGVFDFTAGGRPAAPTDGYIVSVTRNTSAPAAAANAIEANTLDLQLLSEAAEVTVVKSADSVKSSTDCKPEITAELKRPETETVPADVKPQTKSAPNGYILGPRGGCFIVTSGGSKKYVDRSLCSPSTVAAARQ